MWWFAQVASLLHYFGLFLTPELPCAATICSVLQWGIGSGIALQGSSFRGAVLKSSLHSGGMVVSTVLRHMTQHNTAQATLSQKLRDPSFVWAQETETALHIERSSLTDCISYRGFTTAPAIQPRTCFCLILLLQLQAVRGFLQCPREAIISLRKAGWEDTKWKRKKWTIRKPVPQGVLSCKIAVEYFPGEKVKSWLLKKKQLGGTVSWPFARDRQANSAQPFHNFFHSLAGVWKLIYRFTFESKQTHIELSFQSVTSISETQFALKTNKYGSL